MSSAYCIRHPVYPHIKILIGKEVWRHIAGCEGIFQVSNLGHIRTLTRRVWYKRDGGYFATIQGRVCKLGRTKGKAYRFIILGSDKVPWKRRPVHQLVLETFIGPRPTDCDHTRHLNGIGSDNRVENLAWGTAAENARDRETHGTVARGDTSGVATITEAEAREAHHLFATGKYTLREIASKFGTHYGCISSVVKGVSFKHLGLAPLLACRTGSGKYLRNSGETHGNAKLTTEMVLAIRRDAAADTRRGRYSRLSRKYGVSCTIVESVVKRMTYKDVP